jgi:hypothetical protein
MLAVENVPGQRKNTVFSVLKALENIRNMVVFVILEDFFMRSFKWFAERAELG